MALLCDLKDMIDNGVINCLQPEAIVANAWLLSRSHWQNSYLKLSSDAKSNEMVSSTVKPVLSGPVLNGRPVLSGQMSKSRKSTPLSDNCKLYLY